MRDFKDSRRRYLHTREDRALGLINKAFGISASRVEAVHHKLLIDIGIVLEDTEIFDPTPGVVSKILGADRIPVKVEPFRTLSQSQSPWVILQDTALGKSHEGIWFAGTLTDPDLVLKGLKGHPADRGIVIIKPTRDNRWLTLLQLSLFRKVASAEEEDPNNYYK
jgi:hypothetical protein